MRPVVVPGTGDPFGSPWGGQVDPGQRPFLVSAFNGGFKFGDFTGAVIAFGNQYRAPVDGQGSFIVYDDGSFNVGAWPRDVDPNKEVVALRQNLGVLVDGGAPTPAAGSPGNWGASVSGVATMRGGVGVDANGALVWAGGRLSPQDLANALVAAGAVRGMQLDINPDWVNFNSYDVGPDGVAHGNGIFGGRGPTGTSVPMAVTSSPCSSAGPWPRAPPRSSAPRRSRPACGSRADARFTRSTESGDGGDGDGARGVGDGELHRAGGAVGERGETPTTWPARANRNGAGPQSTVAGNEALAATNCSSWALGSTACAAARATVPFPAVTVPSTTRNAPGSCTLQWKVAPVRFGTVSGHATLPKGSSG